MGLCASSNGKNLSSEDRAHLEVEEKYNKAVNKEIANDEEKDSSLFKLLLLGAGESGKSTLFKQMKSLYVEPEMPEEDRQKFQSVIFQNIIEASQHLIEGVAVVRQKRGLDIVVNVQQDTKVIQALGDSEGITQDNAGCFERMWQDEGIQTCYTNRNCFQLMDSTQYFFDRILESIKEAESLSGKDKKSRTADEEQRIKDNLILGEYIPTQEDVLRARVRTTGIVELPFIYEANAFKIFDVGGQRNERKKWIHCFDNVTAVLFVGVLSEYDLQLYEDEKTNRLTETLALFREHVNSRWFTKTSIILFLNKRDLFQEKIQSVPLTVCSDIWTDTQVKRRQHDGEGEDAFAFEDLTVPDASRSLRVPASFEQFYGHDDESRYLIGIERIKEQFKDQFDSDRQYYCHETSAIDKDHFSKIFGAVRDIILRDSLEAAGLLAQ